MTHTRVGALSDAHTGGALATSVLHGERNLHRTTRAANEDATLKHLLGKNMAIQYAQQHVDDADRAEVYRIGTTNTREAIATVQDGRAELIATYGSTFKD